MTLHDSWVAVLPMLEPAIALAPGKPDVLARLMSGHAQLWPIIERDKPIAAVVTEITLVPEKRCRIWLVGGARLKEWAEGFLSAIETWARGEGCVAIWGTQSRRGWLRLVKKFGGEDAGIINGEPAWLRRIA